MRIDARLAFLRAEASATLFRLSTLSRVVRKTGMHRAVRLRGLEAVVRELVRRKRSDPSLLFRFMGENDPHRVGLVGIAAPHGGTIAEERAYSFFEISERIDRVAKGLCERGLRPGDRILVMLKNRPDFILLQAAIGRLGCSAVSTSYRSTPRELAYIAEHSGARAMFFDVDLAQTVREVEGSLTQLTRDRMFSVGGVADPYPTLEGLIATAKDEELPLFEEEPAVVMYTSGTTGKPKGAVRTFGKGSIAGALAFIGETPMTFGEVHLAACPLYHATAFAFVAMSYAIGSSVIVMREFKPEAFLAAVERYRVTTTAVVPTMLHRIVELGEDVIRRYDTSSLKVVITGGAPLSVPLASEFMRLFGDKLYQFYGATETGTVTIAKPEDMRAAPGTIGRAVPGQEVRLYNEQGRVCRVGEVGELYARSGQLISGYHADEASTNEAMREGFFSVGDLARMDERGYFFLEGRKRDMIISGGVNVYPAEVEGVIHDHPAVAEVAVIGVPDEEWGERVRAFVSAKPGETIEVPELLAFCKARLAGPKVPREVVVMDVLPRNPTGKVLKRELREMSRERGE